MLNSKAATSSAKPSETEKVADPTQIVVGGQLLPDLDFAIPQQTFETSL